MNYNYCFKSDIGTTRDSNQDSVYAGTVKTSLGNAFLGVVCDGMGGLSNGEIASRTVANIFRDWFLNEFVSNMLVSHISDFIFDQWRELINKANITLLEISRGSGEQMGTTLSVLLIINKKYYAAQIGDSRIYYLTNKNILQITDDHSYVMEQVKKGLMTETEARLSGRRNVLTRCIGAVREVYGDFYSGEVQSGDSFLISSDGFHAKASLEEIGTILTTINLGKHNKIEKTLSDYIAFRKSAGEKDNITAIVVVLH